MTVNTTDITSGPYPGNDVASAFSYTFRIEDKNQLKVYETDNSGATVLLTVDTNYTVAGIGDNNGGLITRVAGPLPINYTWYIRSDYKLTQASALSSQGGFFPEIHEDAFDKLTFLTQQIEDITKRSIRLSEEFDIAGSFTFNEDITTRANKFLAFDNSGDLFLAGSVANTAVSVFMGTVVDDNDAFEASNTLKSYYVVATKAEAAALPLVAADAGRSIFITSDSGGVFIVKFNATPGTYSDNGGSFEGTVFIPSGGNGTIGILRYSYEPLNVRWFGAVIDGVTDDSAAIVAAALISTVYVPKGVCFVDNNLILKYGIYGDGIGQTILKHGSNVSNTTFITLGAGAPNNPGANCKQLTIDGDQSNNTGFTSAELVLNKGSIAGVIEIKDFNGSGIDQGSYGEDSKCLHCIITGIGSATVGSSFGININVATTKNMEIYGCVIRNCRLNAILGQGVGTTIIRNYFEGNHVQTVPTGGGQISVGSVPANGSMTIITNNYFGPGGGASASGMELNGHCLVGHNTLVGQKAVGIFLQQGLEHQLFSNVIKNGLAEAIAVAANLSNFMINNNQCYDDQSVKTQTTGVLINTGSSDNYTIIGNRLENNKTAALTDGGTGAVKSIMGNTPLSTESWESWIPTIVQGATPTFTINHARLRIIGKTGFISMRCTMIAGTAGTAGTVITLGGWPTKINPANPSGSLVVGQFFITDSGTAFYTGVVTANSATTMRMMAHNSGNYIGAIPNFGLTTGDTVSINVQFNIA